MKVKYWFFKSIPRRHISTANKTYSFLLKQIINEMQFTAILNIMSV